MSTLSFDLRTYAHHRNRSAPRPLLDLSAKTPANPNSPRAVPHHESADHRTGARLQMTFGRCINPADDLSVKNCGKGYSVGGEQRFLDATAKIVTRARITELAAQLRSYVGIVGCKPANRKP